MKTDTARSSVQRVYFGLAAFNVGTLLVSLFLGSELMRVYRASVTTNEAWAERLALYAQLGQLVTEANAPGNDVFVDKDVASQKARLERITKQVGSTFEQAHGDLDSLPEAQRKQLAPALSRSEHEFATMSDEAGAIFEAFSHGDVDLAGTHMGQMDQAFARTSAQLDLLRTGVQRIQGDAFAEQLLVAESSQRAQYGLLGLVVFMVAAVVAYGFRLQRTMAKKQAEIDAANAGMRLVLDNVDQGLVTVTVAGEVTGAQSEAVTRWLGPVPAGTTLWKALSVHDPKSARWLEAGWSMIVDDFMPLEVTLEQLPTRVKAGERTLSIGYRPIFEGKRLERLLIVFTDVTAALHSAQVELQQRETLSMFERVMRDRSGFVEAFEDCARLVKAIVMIGDRDLSVVRRQVHTLKGNSATIGLSSFAATCHEFEDYLTESPGDLSRPMVARLEAEWDQLTTRLHSLAGQQARSEVVLAPEAFDALLAAVDADDVPRASVRSLVESLRMEPATRRLERLAEHAQSVAARLLKGPLHVAIAGHGLRFDRERWSPFFTSLVHLVRNAVDHGLEGTSDRAALGKGVGRLTMSTSRRGDQVEIVVADDGRGLDLDRLLRVARERGLDVKDGVDAMFLDGVTSKSEVTDLSGRGVGMAAVKAAAEALGGSIGVRTKTGEGTTFTFLLPAIGVSDDQATATKPAAPRAELRALAVCDDRETS